MTDFSALLAALLLDRLLGEPRRWHPLVGFGRIVQKLEALGLGRNAHLHQSPWHLRLKGVLAALVAVALPALLVASLLGQAAGVLRWALEALLLYLCIGWRSLEEHGLAVAQSLEQGDLPEARVRAGMMVSRETQTLEKTGVARAATESVLENGSDAIFAPLFWFMLGGAPAAVAYRLANTLDAMWGYRTTRFLHFGWFAARLDDLLNYLPARLCALAYSLAGHTASALRCWRTQAAACSSPNGGPVMAAGAGALRVQLGGPAVYHGALVKKPALGAGEPPSSSTIRRACGLVNRSLLLWVVVAGLLAAISSLLFPTGEYSGL